MSKKLKYSNPSSASVSAMLGQEVMVRKVRGQYIVTNRPIRRKRKPSPLQENRRDLFKAAADYASRQLTIPEAAELYASGITTNKRTAYLVALADCLNAPEVREIDARNYQGRIGDTIRITAIDDFMVREVFVIISNSNGQKIEEGMAFLDKRHAHSWKYTASAPNPDRTGTIILAKAFDRPGNCGKMEIRLTEEISTAIPQTPNRPNFLSSLLKWIR